MSHLKNVQSFEKLKRICTGYGGAYNPGQQNLQVEALNTLLINAEQILSEVKDAKVVYDYATNHREVLFKDAIKLAARITRVLKASGATSLTVEDALALVRKMRGHSKRIIVPVITEGGVEGTHRTSTFGRDYASIQDHFERLLKLVAANPLYMPNETELQVSALNQVLANMDASNEEVMYAEVILSQTRRKRNELFYSQVNSLINTARLVRDYVRGVFGFLSPQHAEMVRLSFTKPIM